MRKIDKNEILATVYKNWLDKLVSSKTKHPEYNSSKGKFFYDIIANLLWIQKGLCAYTERRLQNHLVFNSSNWNSGIYKKFQFAGQLDHYDSTLKNSYGWLWDNFFVIDSDINMKLKRTKKPNNILKPDLPNYDPTIYLKYDLKTHCFIPNPNLNFKIQKQILHDISILGLNFQPVIDIRREYLSPIIEEVKYKRIEYDKAYKKLNQFFTAFELLRDYMLN